MFAKISLILGGVIIIMGGIGYFYFEWSTSKIEELNNQILSLNFANQENLKTIEFLEESMEETQKNNDRLAAAFMESEEANSELRIRLGKVDLERLSASDPEKIKNLINEETIKQLNQLRDLSNPARIRKLLQPEQPDEE